MLNSNLKIEFDLHENELVGREWFGAMAAFDTEEKDIQEICLFVILIDVLHDFSQPKQS